ncbi:MAG: aminotransferase class I/II-fold pyridoxal phosphate-dependent enzyme [Paracoccus sp. (in: a-proteobacteria)]|uniref:aminotransferase class I/II-fold pyridoxal phosphate-dependent enzyme n=1 Tax=Paracoccus sp. TaxID=267 RepID=UPI00405A2A80
MALKNDINRPEVASLSDYNAGLALDRFREVYGIDARAKLDHNESPLGPSPAAITAMRDAAAGRGRYPDATDSRLRHAIGGLVGTDPECVILGNGSEDLIGGIFRAVLRPGDRVVTLCPSFGLHEFGAQSCGAVVQKVPFNPDWSFPLCDMIAAARKDTRIVIFSSPSNPAGPAIRQDEFRQLLDGIDPQALIVFDEAYREYLSDDLDFNACAMMSDAERDWISLRTFSKAYGLAGARIGYGLCSDPALMRALRKTRNPFSVNALAAAGALAALQDDDHLRRNVEASRAERVRVAAILRSRGWDVAPSQANFLFFRTPGKAADLAQALRRRGVLIKAWQETPFTDWARVTIAAPDENDIFLSALSAATADMEGPAPHP